MDIQTFTKAKTIYQELDVFGFAKDKLAKGHCEINIAGKQLPYSKEVGILLYNAISKYIDDKQKEFESL